MPTDVNSLKTSLLSLVGASLSVDGWEDGVLTEAIAQGLADANVWLPPVEGSFTVATAGADQDINTLSPLFLSARSGVIALAVEGALLRFRNGEVTVFYDAEDRASFDHEEIAKRNDTLQHLLTIGLGIGSGVAGGAGIAAQPDSARYHRTLGETFSGSLLGSGGNILFLLGGGVLLG